MVFLYSDAGEGSVFPFSFADSWYSCGIMFYQSGPRRPNTPDLSSRGFYPCYLTLSPYQTSLYPLTSPASVSQTEAEASTSIALWVTEI